MTVPSVLCTPPVVVMLRYSRPQAGGAAHEGRVTHGCGARLLHGRVLHFLHLLVCPLHMGTVPRAAVLTVTPCVHQLDRVAQSHAVHPSEGEKRWGVQARASGGLARRPTWAPAARLPAVFRQTGTTPALGAPVLRVLRPVQPDPQRAAPRQLAAGHVGLHQRHQVSHILRESRTEARHSRLRCKPQHACLGLSRPVLVKTADIQPVHGCAAPATKHLPISCAPSNTGWKRTRRYSADLCVLQRHKVAAVHRAQVLRALPVGGLEEDAVLGIAHDRDEVGAPAQTLQGWESQNGASDRTGCTRALEVQL
jgi:hypothetical protein